MPLLALLLLLPLAAFAQSNPIHVTYLWHMHQPIYFPYESVDQTDGAGRFNFSVRGVHDQRTGAYGDWPKNAVQQGTDLPHAGVQVSFSGSLMENMNGLYGFGWRDHYRWGRNGLRTSRDNPRLDLVGIAYHHSLMPLTTKESMLMQIRLHKEAYADNWASGGYYSKGFWPPECAFDVNMIPALVEEGLEWVIVDNGHFDRACQGYPWAPASSIRPNKADQLNPDPATRGSQWVQLNNVWAPTKVSAPWGYQPRYVQYIDPWSDPANPDVKKIIAVPAARYEGNENARGGYGAFKPENVWGDKTDVNNDPARPMLILCHSDGDNYGMLNADAYNGQHGRFLQMTRSNEAFQNTSVQDYLELYPVPQDDIIHVEPGTWVGIDGGTPFYDKWRENNARDGEHPDLWSWSVLVAAANRVIHADSLEGNYSMNDVRWGIGPDAAKAWHYFLQAETSCHWYWDYDRDNPWDGNATNGANLAIAEANKVIGRHPGVDGVGPTIWPPQRDIYNPGALQYDEAEPASSDFTVFTFVDDVSGLQSVKLYWRVDLDGENPLDEYDNELYAHNPAKVGAWQTVDMAADWYPSIKGPKVPEPANRAMRHRAMIAGQTNVLIDYFVEAIDTKGNISRSDIEQVWVGGDASQPTVSAEQSTPGGPVTIRYAKTRSPLGGGPVFIHIGHNNWTGVVTPAPQMADGGDAWVYTYNPPAGATTISFVFHNGAGVWDNNAGTDWTSEVTSTPPESPATPENLGGTAVSYDRILLSWSLVSGATSYEVLRDGELAGNSTTAGFSDTARTPSTTYTYSVRAVNSAGASAEATAIEVTTPARPAVEDFDLLGNAPGGYRLSSPGMKIHAAIRGTKLYVATWFASPDNANDHFLFVGNQLLETASQTAAPAWTKAPMIALPADTPYLAQESSNGWCGWFNAPPNARATATAQGNILEGVIDLVDTFGSLPETLYVAAASIQSADNGILVAQAPEQTSDNGDIDAAEFLAIPVASIRDSRGDGKLDRLDPRRDFRSKVVGPIPGGLGLQVPTVPGIRYQLQYKPTLADQWEDVGAPITGLGSPDQTVDATVPAGGSAEGKGFFRLQVIE
jgi:hypothetical protein